MGGEKIVVSPFKRPRTKQETIPLFWLVVATSVWNFEEVNSHVLFMSVPRSEHAHTNINTSTHNHSHTHTVKGMSGMPQ